MTTLRFEDYRMPAADFPRENPLPDMGGDADLHASRSRSPRMPDDVVINPELGARPSILPYTWQDEYDRDQQERVFKAAILENETLRAVFLPQVGGRLWTLTHKPTGKELLHKNPVFQPANLAIRNAWFSGGVEWNLGIIGHTPFTCSQLFTEEVDGGERGPILRMYEYERVRQAIYQMDFYLPPQSEFLLTRMRIINTRDEETPMYWWSNMAVDQTPDTRVVVPATSTINFGYSASELGFHDVPDALDTDVTYSVNIKRSMDFFYYLPDGARRYIAALNGKGEGLVQTSTPNLKGRKLFLWGKGPGGDRWQQYLAQPGCEYIEIQAGLGRSQMEYLPMPAGVTWEWEEAYGMLTADPEKVHGPWDGARKNVEDALQRKLPDGWLEEELQATGALANTPGRLVSRGSGWGALEKLRRAAQGGRAFPDHLRFDESSLTAREAPWRTLLDLGVFPDNDGPAGFMVQDEWLPMLEQAAQQGDNPDAWYQLGVMRYDHGDRAGARQAWEKALARRRTPGPLRSLARWHIRHGEREKGLDLLVEATGMVPGQRAMAIECGNRLLDDRQYTRWLAVVEGLSTRVKADGRIRMLEARALIETGSLDKGEAILLGGIVVADIREGEVSLSDLWYRLQEKKIAKAEGIAEDEALRARVKKECPPPAELDFRMNT